MSERSDLAEVRDLMARVAKLEAENANLAQRLDMAGIEIAHLREFRLHALHQPEPEEKL